MTQYQWLNSYTGMLDNMLDAGCGYYTVSLMHCFPMEIDLPVSWN